MTSEGCQGLNVQVQFLSLFSNYFIQGECCCLAFGSLLFEKTTKTAA